MNYPFCFVFAALIFMHSPCHAGLLDELLSEVSPSVRQQSSLDNNTIINGLKEALDTATERAVANVARTDGYFGNQMIKILLPDRIQQAGNLLAGVGYQQQVDELVLSMNRAAEKAAPRAAVFFGDAIRQMTLEDANVILSGADTAATSYFEKTTRSRLFEDFKPTVSASMDKMGTVRVYKEMTGSYASLPMAALGGVPSLDLDAYITNKALDGLFKMVGEEEKKIRTNPAARTTELLRKVFASK